MALANELRWAMRPHSISRVVSADYVFHRRDEGEGIHARALQVQVYLGVGETVFRLRVVNVGDLVAANDIALRVVGCYIPALKTERAMIVIVYGGSSLTRLQVFIACH